MSASQMLSFLQLMFCRHIFIWYQILCIYCFTIQIFMLEFFKIMTFSEIPLVELFPVSIFCCYFCMISAVFLWSIWNLSEINMAMLQRQCGKWLSGRVTSPNHIPCVQGSQLVLIISKPAIAGLEWRANLTILPTGSW